MKSHVKFCLVLALLSAVPLQADAIGRKGKAAKKDSLEMVVKMYTDSLATLSKKLDSLQALSNKGLTDGRYYRLFVPTTFYHSSAGKTLSLAPTHSSDTVTDAVDAALMNVYLKRPDLVVNTESQLKEAGVIRNDIEQTTTQKIELTKKSEPIAEAPVVVPTNVVVKKPNFWKFAGDGNFQFIQNFISSNWYKGGESNYSMVGGLTLTANYNDKDKIKFENKLEMRLGFQTSRDDTIHKFKTNDDLIRYTGKLNFQAKKNWYYSFQMIASTQFTQGLRSNDKKVYSDFMSPFNLNLGLGMDYTVSLFKNKLNGSVNLSALAFEFRYVDRKDIANRHGVVGDHHTLESFGSRLTVDMKWQISDIVSWKTRLYGYTTYSRALVEWENTFAIQVSKYISAKIFLYPRFDDSTKYDDDYGYLQFKEYSSLGLSYSF